MKALIYEGPKQVAVREIPVPKPAAGQALIRVEYCGICGSDIGIFGGTHPRARAPLVMGHELVGVIEEICAPDNGFHVDDRVVPYPLLSCGHCSACRNGKAHICASLRIIGIDTDGGIAEYMCCDTDLLFRVPEGVSGRTAGLIEPLAVTVHALHRSGFRPMDRVAVQGAGPIGLLMALTASHGGAERVFVSDLDEARLELARKLGFQAVNSGREDFAQAVRMGTDGEGVDVVFECSGTGGAVGEATGLCRNGGMVCLVGVYKAAAPVTLPDLHFHELNMAAARVYTRRDFQQAVELAPQMAEKLGMLVSHEIPLSEADKVFGIIRDPASAAVKVLVDCRG